MNVCTKKMLVCSSLAVSLLASYAEMANAAPVAIASSDTTTDYNEKKQGNECPYTTEQIEEKIDLIRQLLTRHNNSYFGNINVKFEYEIEIRRLEKISTTIGCYKTYNISTTIGEFKEIYSLINERQREANEERGKAIIDAGKHMLFK